MRKNIKKKVVTSTINVSLLEVENGTPSFKETDPIKVTGAIDYEKATKLAIKEKGTNTLVVTSIVYDEKMYSMPVEKFIELADEIDIVDEESEDAE